MNIERENRLSNEIILCNDQDDEVVSAVSHYEEGSIATRSTVHSSCKDMLAYFQHKYPEVEQKPKSLKPHVRMMRDIKCQVDTLKTRAFVIARKMKKNSDAIDDTAGLERQSIGSEADDEVPDFFEEDEESYSSVDTDDHQSISTAHLNKSDEARADPDAQISGGRKRHRRLHVGFGNRQRRVAFQKTSLGRALLRIKQKVRPNYKHLTSGRDRWNSSHVAKENPPTAQQYRALEKQLMETKLEFAGLQTELEQTKAELKRVNMEKDWSKEQLESLQYEFKESLQEIADYRLMITHLKNHAQEGARHRMSVISTATTSQQRFAQHSGSFSAPPGKPQQRMRRAYSGKKTASLSDATTGDLFCTAATDQDSLD